MSRGECAQEIIGLVESRTGKEYASLVASIVSKEVMKAFEL